MEELGREMEGDQRTKGRARAALLAGFGWTGMTFGARKSQAVRNRYDGREGTDDSGQGGFCDVML